MDPRRIDPTRIALGKPRFPWPFVLPLLPAIAFSILLGILALRDDRPAWFLLSVVVAVAFAWLAYRFFRSQQWGYVPFISLHDGNITFIPSPNSYDTLAVHSTAFPPGGCLEYRVETGDMYFNGDRGQALGRSLWVIEPNGNKKLLVRDFLLFVNFNLAARNLKGVGIPFQVTRVYDGEKGEHVETDITPTVVLPRRWLSGGDDPSWHFKPVAWSTRWILHPQCLDRERPRNGRVRNFRHGHSLLKCFQADSAAQTDRDPSELCRWLCGRRGLRPVFVRQVSASAGGPHPPVFGECGRQ
jgi:hypothetical protein